VPYYIALTATQFHSPSTSKFGENPDNTDNRTFERHCGKDNTGKFLFLMIVIMLS